MTSEKTPVTVRVSPPDAARETAAVLQAAVVIAVVAALVAGVRREEAGQKAPVYPYQVRFEEQPADVQLLYRELLSGLEEVVRDRSEVGAWPDVRGLAENFVAPFAPDPGSPFDVSWEFAKDGDFVNYLARPVPGLGGPAFLLLIQENVLHPPGSARNEFDRVLDDGTIVHFGVWMHEDPESVPDFMVSPERAGWKQIITGDTSVPGTS